MIKIDIVDFEEKKNELLSIRHKVFTLEQSVPEELDEDGLDSVSIHVLLTEGSIPAATARIQPDGHIGRVAVKKEYRGKGYGKAVLEKLIQYARIQQLKSVYLGSQLQAVGFYNTLGFIEYGNSYLDAGIDHIMMRLELEDISF